jgi:transposase
MNEQPFEALVKSDRSATSFLKKLCWENYRRFCIRCRSNQFYRLAGEKFRCRQCGYTFHDFSGRWINGCRIGSRKWLMIIKLFELELSAKDIVTRVALSYPTVLKAIEIIRLAIMANSTDFVDWLDYFFYWREAPTAEQRFQSLGFVFGVIEEHGKVRIDIVKNIALKTVLKLKSKTLGRSSINYTDECSPYKTLVYYDHGNGYQWVVSEKSDLIYKINGESDFWCFAKTRIAKHRGISKEKFPQYLKEIEFRYNHREKNFFYLLCEYLVSFIPCSEGRPKSTKPKNK